MSTYQKLAIARQKYLDLIQQNMEGTGCPPSCSIYKHNHLRIMEGNIRRKMKACELDLHSDEAEDLNCRVLWEKVRLISVTQEAVNIMLQEKFDTSHGRDQHARLVFNVWLTGRRKGEKLEPLPQHIVDRFPQETRVLYFKEVQ